MKKRIASIALSLAMCLTLLPTAAYAEDVSEGGHLTVSQARLIVRLSLEMRKAIQLHIVVVVRKATPIRLVQQTNFMLLPDGIIKRKTMERYTQN